MSAPLSVERRERRPGELKKVVKQKLRRKVGAHILKSQHVAALHENENNSCASMEAGLMKINLSLNRSLVD